MSGRKGRRNRQAADTAAQRAAGQEAAAAVAAPNDEAPAILPSGRIPAVGMREIVAALHRRRARRRESANGLRHALGLLADSVDRHLERIAELRAAVEAQGGDLESLQYYDNVMAKLRNELRSAERALADAFHSAAEADGGPGRS
ncbi:MAG: hypothetical protein AABZ35_04610 [Gemmatimonadota bacterium]